MVLRGPTTILVPPIVLFNCTIIDVVRRFEWSANHPVTYSTVFLLRKLEKSHGLFSVLSLVGPYCEAEWEPLRKWH